MTLKGDAKFKGKSTRGLKNHIRYLVNFHASSWKSGNLHFDGILLSKTYKDLDEKVQRSYVSWHWRVMQSLKENWLLAPKMTWVVCWILIRAEANLKNCTLMYYFCQWHAKFQLKKHRRIISHDTEKNSKLWRKTYFLFGKRHEEFGEL